MWYSRGFDTLGFNTLGFEAVSVQLARLHTDLFVSPVAASDNGLRLQSHTNGDCLRLQPYIEATEASMSQTDCTA